MAHHKKDYRPEDIMYPQQNIVTSELVHEMTTSYMEYAMSVGRLLPKGLAGAPITAADGTDIPFWAKEDLKIATAQGILNGYPDGTLKPERSVTRAEAVKILYTIFGIGK